MEIEAKMHKLWRAVKLLMNLMFVSLAVVFLFYVVDWTLQNTEDSNYKSRFVKYNQVYTTDPTDDDPDVAPDKNWSPKPEPPVLMGFIPQFVLYMVVAIVVIVVFGFFLAYYLYRRESH